MDSLTVVFETDRENDCIGKSVGGVVQPAECVGDGMYVSDTCACEGKAGLIGGNQHLGSGFHVVTIPIRTFQIAEDFTDSLFGEPYALVGVIGPADIGLNSMCQCIHTGRGGDVRRQFPGHFRIQNGIFRNEMQVHQSILMMGVTVRNYCCDGGLRTRPGRGWYRDQKRDLLHDLQESCHLTNLGVRANNTGSSRLCGIHRRSAADSNKAVTIIFQIEFLNPVYCIDGRVGFHLGEQNIADTGRFKL